MQDVKYSTPPPPTFSDAPPPYEEAAIPSSPLASSTSTQSQQPPYQHHPSSISFLPIAIPQTSSPSNDAFFPSFTRAYPPHISNSIPLPQFLQFIDTLNSLFIATAGLQIASHIGTTIQHLPLPLTGLAGAGINYGAKSGSQSGCFKKAEKYVQEVNGNLFGPKGLRVRLLRTGDVMGVIGLQGELLRLGGVSGDEGVSRQSLRAMEGKVAKLQFEGLPAVQGPEGWWDRQGCKEAKRREERRMLKMMDSRERAMREEQRSRKGEKRMDKADRKEVEMAMKLYWIVIEKTEVTEQVSVADQNL